MKIAVVIPSRGLMFSRTAEHIIKNLKHAEQEYKFYFAHRKPIPDCFEEPVTAALSDKEVTHIWIVEDDMKMPENALHELINKEKAVVTADYPITAKGRGSVFKDADGKVIYCGTGCLLIKREVFDEMKAPYFHTFYKWNVKNFGEYIRFKAVKNKTGDGYGLHDINFCMTLNKLGIPIHVIDTQLGQYKLNALGKAGTNDGAHDIEVWDNIVPNQRLKEIQSYPVEKTGELIEVQTQDGGMNVTKAHAHKLVKAGKATIPPRTASQIVWG